MSVWLIRKVVKNQTVAKAMFAYGCLTTPLFLYIYVSFAILEQPDVPEFLAAHGSPKMWVSIGSIHFLTLVLTTMQSPMGERDPLWAPVIRPSKSSILIGRAIVFVATCNVLFWFPYAPWQFVAAMFLHLAVYTAVHWALRPENVFSWPVLRFLRGSGSNPLMRPLVERSIARRPAMPQEEWIPELLRCCERAVESKRLVNSETPGEDEIDGLQFQVRVLDELGSKTCVLRYKKRLSRDGFRAIQKFLRRVASLDRKQPNQAAWQEIMEAARSVLAEKGTLVRENARATKGRFSN
jgi:hypothetical protein